MGRILRLGFAMGGGVSLGSFQAAALSQAIKLAVAHARYTDEANRRVPYERVELDVFSGASSGAFSLSIMLRGLVQLTEDQRQIAKAHLLADPQIGPVVFNALDSAVQEDLIAAQAMQDVQDKVWTQQLGIQGWVGRSVDPPRDLTETAGLLDRGLLEDLARTILRPGGNLVPQRLLAKRVLFACTLTNLTPVIIDARADLSADHFGYVALRDGMRCKVHRELRVFDFFFDNWETATCTPPDFANLPRRWYRMQLGPVPAKNGALLIRGNLNEDSAWAVIGATCIASGAFPFAFEPVPLTRYAEEFENGWPKELHDKSSHIFTYIDGGTFNNEPIREAFRLASYIDSLTPDADFDRRIVFCTPFASPEGVSYRLPVAVRCEFHERKLPFMHHRLQAISSPTLDRLTPHVGTVLNALLDEGRNQEGNKIVLTRNQFAERDQFREYFNIARSQPSPEGFLLLFKYCSTTLDHDQSDSIIPPTPLGLKGELRRVIWEWRASNHIPDDASAQSLSDCVDVFLNPATDLAAVADASTWLMLLNFVALDLLMDLQGKSRDAELIAIGPFQDLRLESMVDPKTGRHKLNRHTGNLQFDTATQRPKTDTRTGLAIEDPSTQSELKVPTATPIPLGAAELGAFAGLMSPTAMHTAMDVGRHCALAFFAKANFIDLPVPPDLTPESLAGQESAFRTELRENINFAADRVAEVVRTNMLFKVPLIDGLCKSLAADFVRAKIVNLPDAPPAGVSYEMRLRLPSDGFCLSGPGVGDVDSIEAPARKSGANPSLVTMGRLDGHGYSRWYLGNLFGDGTSLQVNSPRFMWSSSFCSCELPPSKLATDSYLQSYPVLSVQLVDGDKGTVIPASRWKIEQMIEPLDEALCSKA